MPAVSAVTTVVRGSADKPRPEAKRGGTVCKDGGVGLCADRVLGLAKVGHILKRRVGLVLTRGVGSGVDESGVVFSGVPRSDCDPARMHLP